MEPLTIAYINARKRGINDVYCGTLDEEYVIDACILNIMILDVLEHIEDYEVFLKLINSKLKHNGQ